MLLELANISKSFGKQEVLKDISFSVDEGEVLGFLGPNGAGKSTSMRIITGLLNADSGTVKVMGDYVNENTIELRKNIGYLPEHNPLYTDLYIKEYLDYVADSYGVKNKKSRIAELIEMTKLTREQHKKIGTLSKGYRQRVGLAQALIHNPKILILDEPMSGLDPNQLEEIRQLIKNISKGKTVLLSSHIMQEIEQTCSRVLILNKGILVADDNVLALASTTKEFHVSVEFLSVPTAEQIALFSAFELHEERGVYHFVSKEDIREKLFRISADNGLVILSMVLQKNSLEMSFRELTRD
ncbi:MAG: ATP-binding cassette domain-containing protein [Bacteroidales bacterium]